MKNAVGCLFLAISIVLSIPINGFVIAVLWGWFIVPVFAFRQISVSEAIGLSIFLSAINPIKSQTSSQFSDASVSEDDVFGATTWRIVGTVFFGPALTVAFAWVWHTFLM